MTSVKLDSKKLDKSDLEVLAERYVVLGLLKKYQWLTRPTENTHGMLQVTLVDGTEGLAHTRQQLKTLMVRRMYGGAEVYQSSADGRGEMVVKGSKTDRFHPPEQAQDRARRAGLSEACPKKVAVNLLKGDLAELGERMLPTLSAKKDFFRSEVAAQDLWMKKEMIGDFGVLPVEKTMTVDGVGVEPLATIRLPSLLQQGVNAHKAMEKLRETLIEAGVVDMVVGDEIILKKGASFPPNIFIDEAPKELSPREKELHKALAVTGLQDVNSIHVGHYQTNIYDKEHTGG